MIVSYLYWLSNVITYSVNVTIADTAINVPLIFHQNSPSIMWHNCNIILNIVYIILCYRNTPQTKQQDIFRDSIIILCVTLRICVWWLTMDIVECFVMWVSSVFLFQTIISSRKKFVTHFSVVTMLLAVYGAILSIF